MDRWLVTVCDLKMRRHADHLVKSAALAGWPYKIAVYTPTRNPAQVDGCDLRVVEQKATSPTFNDARWLLCQVGLDFPLGDEIVIVGADCLMLPAFGNVFGCLGGFDLASPVWNMSNSNIMADYRRGNHLFMADVPNHNEGVVVARISPATIRFFRAYLLAAFASCVVGRGTVCAFQLALAAWDCEPGIVPDVYHCIDAGGWLAGDHPDARLIHFAGRMNKQCYPMALAEVLK